MDCEMIVRDNKKGLFMNVVATDLGFSQATIARNMNSHSHITCKHLCVTGY